MRARYACFRHGEIVDCCKRDRRALLFVARKFKQIEHERKYFRATCLHGTSIRLRGTNLPQQGWSNEILCL